MTMDTAKLEKMKVAELRHELQIRGLDTKGIKAVLIERLKAAIDNKTPVEGGTSEIAEISTPSRRSRRTRSMTRSPSPSPVKKAEPTLEPLVEEDKTETQKSEMEEDEDDKKSEEESQTSAKKEDEEEAEAKTNEEVENAEDVEMHEDAQDDSSCVESENKEKSTSDSEMPPENSGSDEKTMDVDVTPDSKKEEKSKKEPDSKIEENDKHTEKKDKRLSRKRSHSKSRSRSRSRSRTRDRSRSRSRSKNSRSRSPRGKRSTSRSKNIDESTNEEDEPVIEDKQFGLSWLDSDLHLTIDPVTFTSAKPMSQEIYSLVWSGARTNYGVREGKVCYEVRLAEETNVNQFKDEPFIRGLRCGFSTIKTSLMLGEGENSFAYCETGKKVLNGEFIEYGKPFKLDDVVGCYLDLDSTPSTIQFTLNGEELGTAFEFNKEILGEEDALFPHILLKGYEVSVNFADSENLLGNVERPKRMRRKEKPRKDSLKSDDASAKDTSINEDNWEIVDEAKMDDNENDDEKNEKSEEEGKEGEEVKEDKEGEKVKEGDQVKDDDEVKDDEKVKDDEQVKDDKEVSKVEKKEDEEKKSVLEDESVEKKDDKVENKEEADEKKNDIKKDKTAEVEEDKNKEEVDEKESKKSLPEDAKENGHKASDHKKKSRESKDSDYVMEEVEPEEREEVVLLSGYELIALTPEDKFISGPQRPESRKECEVYLLVGLPGAGKTHWTLNHIKENPEKRYHIIGADDLISKMTIDGKPRKPLHKGNWDRVYELCLQSLSALEEIATKRRRNYILDQTNAFASAQRRKMKGFGDFKRNAVVCIPSEEELKKRNQLKTEAGTENTIKESTLNNLKASFTLPSLEFGWFDNIIYTDLKDDEAKEEVKRYNEKGSKDIDASRDKRPRRDNRQRDDRRRYEDRRRDDFRGSRWKGNNSNDRRGGGGSGNRWGPPNRGSSAPWRDDRGYGGGGGGGGRSYDNRNNRYSSGGGGGGGSQNWVTNNRNRYDDRFAARSGGNSSGGGRSYDSYGGGSRDYRDRGRDRNGEGGDNGSRRDGGGYRSGNNQRDFRSGHRDNRTEDSRGGFERSKYTSNDEGYAYHKPSGHQNSSSQGGKWVQMQGSGNWGGQQQLPQQEYWGYDQSQGYGNQQQPQWPINSADPRQQQWASWYQNNSQQQQQQGTMMPDNSSQQYWSQYSYPNQGGTTVMSSHSSGDGSSKK